MSKPKNVFFVLIHSWSNGNHVTNRETMAKWSAVYFLFQCEALTNLFLSRPLPNLLLPVLVRIPRRSIK